jgi:hypothetical protein
MTSCVAIERGVPHLQQMQNPLGACYRGPVSCAFRAQLNGTPKGRTVDENVTCTKVKESRIVA